MFMQIQNGGGRLCYMHKSGRDSLLRKIFLYNNTCTGM